MCTSYRTCKRSSVAVSLALTGRMAVRGERGGRKARNRREAQSKPGKIICAMNNTNDAGPKMEPSGTPAVVFFFK
ncbi:hypothetical protein E2C01_036547 [Portunus trituberculatus]|uniref:Uncharacterized protein n=1 Tax=Portunus trituberculatus TaxID=210409 RepID=A0A5B7FEM1_PORTR|nr:hypothetical protein [Portunus trituberculatus]